MRHDRTQVDKIDKQKYKVFNNQCWYTYVACVKQSINFRMTGKFETVVKFARFCDRGLAQMMSCGLYIHDIRIKNNSTSTKNS